MKSKVIIEMLFMVVGGLGIFLLGMKYMSDGMQAYAGEKLRRLINAITGNPIVACGVGTLVTCLVQSSSITTVMVVGMVNSSIMTLTQAIGVILGANIGTTITGWILVLKIGKYGLPIIGFSAIFYLFTNRENIRHLATVTLGLGMIFFGLELMKNGFSPIKDVPIFLEWFSKFSPTNYLGVMKCVAAGAVLTAIVQSSSATLGITMGLAFTGIIDFPTAAALVLGENIGTTITAFLASLGSSYNAKRASYAHILFNIIGVLWITSIFPIYMKLIRWISITDPGLSAIGTDGQTIYPYAMKGIALTHTVFNVVNVLLFLPLVPLMVKLLEKIVPEREEEEVRLTALDVRMLETPVVAIEQSQKEITKMGNKVLEMLDYLRELIVKKEGDRRLADILFKYEDDLDIVQKEVVEFLSRIMGGTLSHEMVDDTRMQLRMADEYESISDYITNILKLNLKMIENNYLVSKEGERDLLDLHDRVKDYISTINKAVKEDNKNILPEARNLAKIVTNTMKRYRSEHVARVEKGEASPLKSLIYTDMLNAYRRIKDHALNIAEALSGEK
ncbi:MAG: Na/Pi cotransporter family protein [Nitrospinae bacterium]|nr:Na/Pi cotransporter family protein [Nitrospinota bacterium]